MAPSKVDPNRKQARSSKDKVEEDLFINDRMARTVSVPNQVPVHLAKCHLKTYIMNVLTREMHGNVQF
jgi:hypothetical protein